MDRRDFLKTSGSLAASALTAASIPNVHAQGGDTVQVALVGCGGRGTGAAEDALSTKGGAIKLVAMADVLENRLKNSHRGLSEKMKDQVKVPDEARFVGFDGYKKAIDLMGPGDVVILATPLAFRAVHFKYAIDKGINVFMEKPVTADGPTSRRMLELSDAADKKGIKCGVGLMVRHCRGRQELEKRIQDGEIGDITMMRAYRMHGPVGSCFTDPKPATEKSEVLWQVKRFHSFLWASGGLFSDFYIHQIDECSWMKGSWPVKAQAVGGRHFRGDAIDQNFDSYQVEYTYKDGTKLFFYGRTMQGARSEMASYVHGTKGSGIVSMSGHTPGKVRTFKGHNLTDDKLIWAYPQPEANPYRLEWQDLIDAVRNNKPYNEVRRGVEASLVTSMGRMAAHTAQEITYDQMLNCPHEFSAGTAELNPDAPAPVQAKDGKYPVPTPGQKPDDAKEYREYY